MSEKSAFRDSLEAEFADADFPVENQMDLVPALSNGAQTTFEGETVSIQAMEMATKASNHMDSAPNGGFRYDNVNDLTEDLIYGLEQEGFFE